MHIEPLPATLRSPDRRYAVTLEETDEDTGDFTRYKVLFQRGRRTPVRIDDSFSGWVYITPDSRFVFVEPLYVLDVREWKQYALFETLEIPNHTSIEAISGDGRRLFISRRDCVMDCHVEPVVQYFELTLPGRLAREFGVSVTAGPPQIAYKTAASPDGQVIRLERVMDLEVIVPHEDKEDVTSNLLARRASIAREECRGGMQIITARVPLADMFGYTTDLREWTLGRGTCMMKPAGWLSGAEAD